jgi:hypothetical protein
MGRSSRWETMKNAAEEAQGAAHVGRRERETAEQETQIVAVGRAHRGRRVACGAHHLVNDAGQAFEVSRGCGGRLVRRVCVLIRRSSEARRELVEADGHSLAEIHRGLAGVGRDLHQGMAAGKVIAGEAAFFSSEDESDTASAAELLAHQRSERGQCDDRLLRLAASERARAENEGCAGDSFLKRCRDFCGFEQPFCADGGARLAPMRLVGRDHGEMGDAEVGQGAGCRADVERIARRDENHADGIEVFVAGMARGGQRTIVEAGQD